MIQTASFFGNGVLSFAQPPILLVNNLCSFFEKKILEFFYRFLHLFIRQNGSHNENGFVMIQHNCTLFLFINLIIILGCKNTLFFNTIFFIFIFFYNLLFFHNLPKYPNVLPFFLLKWTPI